MKKRNKRDGAVKRTRTATLDFGVNSDEQKIAWRFNPQIVPVLISMATSTAKSALAFAAFAVVLLLTNFLPSQLPTGPLPVIFLLLALSALGYVVYHQVKLYAEAAYLMTSTSLMIRGRHYTYRICIKDIKEVRVESIPFLKEKDVIIFAGTVTAADGVVRDSLRLRSVRDCDAFQVAFGERQRELVDSNQRVSIVEGRC